MRCSALRRDGEQCRARAVRGGERCARHGSERSDEEAGKRGPGGRGDRGRTGGRAEGHAQHRERSGGASPYYAAALDKGEFDAYLQALGLESLRDEAALIRAKVRAHLGGDGDERRELPLLLRAIDVLVRVVQADRAASKNAAAQSHDLAKVVELVLAGLDGDGVDEVEGARHKPVARGEPDSDDGADCPPPGSTAATSSGGDES